MKYFLIFFELFKFIAYFMLFCFLIFSTILAVQDAVKRANAQVQLEANNTATVPKSAYYLCQQKCEELINGEF